MKYYIWIDEHNGVVMSAHGYPTEAEMWDKLRAFIKESFFNTEDSVTGFELDTSTGESQEICLTNATLEQELIEIGGFLDED